MGFFDDQNTIDAVNAALAGMRDDGTIEPIDEVDCGPFDYADVTGLWDEMYPEPMDSWS